MPAPGETPVMAGTFPTAQRQVALWALEVISERGVIFRQEAKALVGGPLPSPCVLGDTPATKASGGPRPHFCVLP